ncbi:MAG: hypothetical protein HY673_20605, partial [Chloroflexi bacterium]|nr:hypothetical protein [Chloroflexota bacterium]
MSEQGSRIAREALDAQRQHWERTFSTTPQMFGDELVGIEEFEEGDLPK